MLVELSSEQVKAAKRIGNMRTSQHVDAGRPTRWDAARDTIGDQQTGVLSRERADEVGGLGEYAVAVAFGVEWDGAYKSLDEWLSWRETGNDVAGIEVRTTRHPKGRLVLHKEDPDDVPFVLVRQLEEASFDIVGWLFGGEGKRWGEWRDMGYGLPCFYVPTEKLRPPDTGRCDRCGNLVLSNRGAHWVWASDFAVPVVCGRVGTSVPAARARLSAR